MRDFIYMTGEARWAKVQPHQLDSKHNNWSLKFAPDKEGLKILKASGLELKANREDGDKKDFYRIRRDSQKLYKSSGEVQQFGPPVVVIATGQVDKDGIPVVKPYEGLIGNGSIVTVKVEVYKAGAKVGHRLHGVRIDQLVEYKVDPNKPREASTVKEPSLEMPF
jgi:hypothetical protein